MKSGMIIWGIGIKRLIDKFLSYPIRFQRAAMRIKAIVAEWEEVDE